MTFFYQPSIFWEENFLPKGIKKRPSLGTYLISYIFFSTFLQHYFSVFVIAPFTGHFSQLHFSVFPLFSLSDAITHFSCYAASPFRNHSLKPLDLLSLAWLSDFPPPISPMWAPSNCQPFFVLEFSFTYLSSADMVFCSYYVKFPFPTSALSVYAPAWRWRFGQ